MNTCNYLVDQLHFEGHQFSLISPVVAHDLLSREEFAPAEFHQHSFHLVANSTTVAAAYFVQVFYFFKSLQIPNKWSQIIGVV